MAMASLPINNGHINFWHIKCHLANHINALNILQSPHLFAQINIYHNRAKKNSILYRILFQVLQNVIVNELPKSSLQGEKMKPVSPTPEEFIPRLCP